MAVGLVYAILILPYLLPSRAAPEEGATKPVGGRHFLAEIAEIAEIKVDPEAALVGMAARGSMFPDLAKFTVRFVERDGNQFLPPFDDI